MANEALKKRQKLHGQQQLFFALSLALLQCAFFYRFQPFYGEDWTLLSFDSFKLVTLLVCYTGSVWSILTSTLSGMPRADLSWDIFGTSFIGPVALAALCQLAGILADVMAARLLSVQIVSESEILCLTL